MKVDLVYTYVSQDDDDLNKQRRFFAGEEVQADAAYRAGSVRFRDNGELAYSLQTVRRCLPFLNNIYIVHAGRPPEWLSQQPDVTLVNQTDILPKGVGPIFQSDLVEAFIHKIDGLSEHYLYSNDDYFFSRPHEVSDFYDKDGVALVALCGRFMAIPNPNIDRTYLRMERNSVLALQKRLKHFLPHIRVGEGRTIAGISHPRQVLRARLNGHRLLNTTTHVTQPYRRSLWAQFHKVFENEIDSLSKMRFRSPSGYTTNLMYHHFIRSLGAARFSYEEGHLFLDRRDAPAARAHFSETLLAHPRRVTRFCLNDGAAPSDDGWRDFIMSTMRSLGYAPTELTPAG